MDISLRVTIEATGLLIGRLLLASLFVLEGWSKLKGYNAAAAYMNHFGVPGALLPLVIAAEIVGGMMIAVGWQTRVAALALAAFCILTAVLFHADLVDRNQLLHLEKDLAIAGGLMVLGIMGAGKWSLDARTVT